MTSVEKCVQKKRDFIIWKTSLIIILYQSYINSKTPPWKNCLEFIEAQACFNVFFCISYRCLDKKDIDDDDNDDDDDDIFVLESFTYIRVF